MNGPALVGSENQWGSLTNQPLGFGYVFCHSFRLQICGTGQEVSQNLHLAQEEGELWPLWPSGAIPEGEQAGLHPRAPQAGQPLPIPTAQGVSCSLWNWLQGSPTRVPGNHSCPAPTHTVTNGKLNPPAVAGAQGPSDGTGPGASPRPYTRTPAHKGWWPLWPRPVPMVHRAPRHQFP